MNFDELSYRALQAECKERGINAAGTRADLLKRLKEDALGQDEPPALFVFVGDKARTWETTKTNSKGISYTEWVTMPADNPPQITIPGSVDGRTVNYTFALNGAPVEVADPNLIRRFRNGSHFEEVTPTETGVRDAA